MTKLLSSLLIASLFMASCIGNEAAPPSTVAEEYAVYAALIESLYSAQDTALLVIKDRTAVGISPNESLDSETEYIRKELGAAIESETLDDYRAKNRQPIQLAQDFALDVPYVLLSEAEVAEVFEQDGGWAQFYTIYPDSQGIMTLSRVGFSAQMDEALVYIGNQADYRAGRGYYVLLTKKEGVWTVDDMVIAWIS